MKSEFLHTVLMQYQTPLPDQADLVAIRQRVTDLGPIYDRYPGLHFKVMAVNSINSAPINEYTSIYLWRDLQSMTNFLAGDNFYSYINAFARPPVRWWLPHWFAGELESVAKAQFALRQTVGIPRTAKIGEFLNDWEGRAPVETCLFRIIAFDPGSWELVTFSLWDQEPPLRWKSELYSLVHVSLPGQG